MAIDGELVQLLEAAFYENYMAGGGLVIPGKPHAVGWVGA